MADVVIQHCTLRILRHGGWSWGRSRDELVEAASRALPTLLARHLAALFPDGAAGAIAETVRIRLGGTWSELAAVGARTDLGGSLARTWRVLDARVAQALVEALLPTLETVAPPRVEAQVPASARSRPEADGLSSMASALLRLLLGWRAEGDLLELLDSCSLEMLIAWHAALLAPAVAVPPSGEPSGEDPVEALVRRAAARLQALADLPTRLRVRLALLAEAWAILGLAPTAVSVRSALDRLLPVAEDLAVAGLPTHDSGVSSVPHSATWGSRRRADISARRAGVSSVRQGEFYAPSVLPFLILGPLSRIGYLEALAAVAAASRLAPALPLFAGALAYKVLDPPARGWHRRPSAVASATVFAGLSEALAEPALVDLAAGIEPHLAPLDALLAANLGRGHTPGKPVVVHRTGADGFLLIESEGMSPIAWGAGPDELAGPIAACAATVLVPAESADPALLAVLDRVGTSFVTDARPSRGERLRALRHPHGDRFWSNDRVAAPSTLLALGRRIRVAADDAAAMWSALFAERSSVPLAQHPVLERSLTLAAGVALGAIAWVLFRDREPVTPLLALERFATLGGQVRHDDRSVRVCVPLGRRHQDLLQHGLLADVVDAPWLAGRVLSFSGG